MAQDPVKLDPTHYTVEFENAQVRVLRIKYGPREKSAMHEHPANVAVFLTDAYVRFTLPNGRTEERRAAAGEAEWDGGGKHHPENLGDQPLELVLVELKARPATKKPAMARAAKKPATKKATKKATRRKSR